MANDISNNKVATMIDKELKNMCEKYQGRVCLVYKEATGVAKC